MAIDIEVKKDLSCDPDPADMKLDEHESKDVKWKREDDEEFEFTIIFTRESPFGSGTKIFKSKDGEIEAKEVKHHVEEVRYNYEVESQNPTGQQHSVDPGLIIRP